MSYRVEFETYIKGGLPVVVRGVVYAPEPDVGISSAYADYDLFWLRGGVCKVAVSRDDHQRILEECCDA